MWQQYPDQGWGWHGEWMWWMPFHGILWLIIVVGVVIGVIALIRFMWRAGNRPRAERGGSSARDLLDLRYAKGEIGRDEYFEKKKDLI
jgi:putative membrane protein